MSTDVKITCQIRLDCIWDIKSTSHGLTFSGLHCHASGLWWRCQWVDPNICSWAWFAIFKALDSCSLHCLCCYYMIWILEPRSKDVKEHSQHHFNLSFRGQGEVEYLHYMPTDFLVGCGLWHISSMTTACHKNASPSIWYHCKSSLHIDMQYSFGMSVNVGPSGNTPYDIQDTTQLHYLWLHSYLIPQMVGRPVHTYNSLDSCNLFIYFRRSVQD